uniref:Phorbol-ester/DAG-type domain-containing protein n=1 Tax=Heterorhabditis bacteriophora TaxID=37862 RepID=A0A1I7XNA5_HETBA
MGSVRDAPMTAAQLAAHCANCFDHDGELSDEEYPQCLYMAHQWLMDSTQLIAQFLALFQETRDDSLLRRRICLAVAYWIRRYPMHFDGQPQLCALVVRLRTIAEDVPLEIREKLDVSNLPSYAWLRAMSMRHPVARQVSLSFEQWSPEDISTSLSHIDFKVLSRISIAELKKYVKEGSLAGTPILERSISVFNNLSNWVQCMVLSKPTPKERADIVIKFINVGKHLRRLCNFNTLMAVIGGITHSNISRLSKTNSQLSPEIKKKCYLECDYSQAYNSFRLQRLANLLSHFMIFNQRQYNFPDANLDLINTLKVSLDIRYNEEDIYELSLRREPRTFMTFEPSHNPVVFAEWASGVSAAPDPETVNKHVSAMVDAVRTFKNNLRIKLAMVFKHYDHDRDGYISQAEFRQISGNFPFIDPFGTIDLDRDGQISKEELKAYFVKANKDSIDFRKGFKHNFHETTFLTPTTCIHCGKVLWGLIRQGWKCKDCGLSVHSCCKENAVAECRRKSSGGGIVDWLSSPRGGTNGSMRNKLFLSYKRNPRFRTVSTVSSSPSPEPVANPPECSTSAGNSSRSNRLQLPSIRSIRPQSESADY